jgi:2,3-bisphosphoglycerate-dependent phosphoglycerate mutase
MDINFEEILGVNIEKAKNELQQFTDKGHYEHSLRACITAVELAEKFGADKEKAYLAALLHDYARKFCMDEGRVLEYCEEHGIELDEYSKNVIPHLAHGVVGADMVMRRFGITDAEVLSAIKRHSGQYHDMTFFDKIIALADAIESSRGNGLEIIEAQNVAKNDLDRALILIGRGGIKSYTNPNTKPKSERTKTSIFFVRHAQSDPSSGTDRTHPLTWGGIVESRRVAAFFNSAEIDAIYSSPYQRCLSTINATALLHELEVIQDERLRESKYGELDGVFNEVIRNRWSDFTWCEEGGETLGGLQRRNIAAVSEILEGNENKNIVICTHGTALSVILNYYDPMFGRDNYLRIVGFTPYIIRLDFNGNEYVRHEELYVVEK